MFFTRKALAPFALALSLLTPGLAVAQQCPEVISALNTTIERGRAQYDALTADGVDIVGGYVESLVPSSPNLPTHLRYSLALGYKLAVVDKDKTRLDQFCETAAISRSPAEALICWSGLYSLEGDALFGSADGDKYIYPVTGPNDLGVDLYLGTAEPAIRNEWTYALGVRDTIANCHANYSMTARPRREPQVEFADKDWTLFALGGGVYAQTGNEQGLLEYACTPGGGGVVRARVSREFPGATGAIPDRTAGFSVVTDGTATAFTGPWPARGQSIPGYETVTGSLPADQATTFIDQLRKASKIEIGLSDGTLIPLSAAGSGTVLKRLTDMCVSPA